MFELPNVLLSVVIFNFLVSWLNLILIGSWPSPPLNIISFLSIPFNINKFLSIVVVLPQLSATVNLILFLPIFKWFFCSSKNFSSSVLSELSLSLEVSFSFLSPFSLEDSSFTKAASSFSVVCPWFSISSELEVSPLSEPELLSVPSESPFPSVLELPLPEALPLLSVCVPPLLVSFGTIVTCILELSIIWSPVGLSLSSTTFIFFV